MKILLFLFTIFLCIGTAHAVDYPFSLTTTSISSGGTFQFKISASGTFYVDCGTGGTLSGTGVSGTMIDRTSTTNEDTYTCTYSSSGTKTIQFGGVATGYNTYYATAAISFGYNDQILSISGNLSKMFPFLGSGSGQFPRFMYTFYSCDNITTIPGTLFSDYRGDLSIASHMFNGTFAWSTNITSIHENLFAGVTIGAPYMFYNTFLGCIRLSSIPENLFINITNSAEGMFAGTFRRCPLTSLPKQLFAHFTTAAPYMFQQTFTDCYNLRNYVPPTLFAGLIANGSPYATDMMLGVFDHVHNPSNNLDTTCPAGTTQYRTGYEQYWETGNGTAVSCEPNTLNVNWWNGNTQLSVGSESQTCEYGDTITVPTINATKNGYHFNGWKIKTNQ
jgi:hypothetical protein